MVSKGLRLRPLGHVCNQHTGPFRTPLLSGQPISIRTLHCLGHLCYQHNPYQSGHYIHCLGHLCYQDNPYQSGHYKDTFAIRTTHINQDTAPFRTPSSHMELYLRTFGESCSTASRLTQYRGTTDAEYYRLGMTEDCSDLIAAWSEGRGGGGL